MDYDDLSQLYLSIGPRLLAYFRHHRSTEAVAQDLLQETFLRALRHMDRLRSAASPGGYLFGIARHLRLDAMRSRSLTEGDAVLLEVDRELAEEDPRLQEMRKAIDRLAEPHRETLLLKVRHQLTYEEIAEVLQVPIGTVRSRLHYAVAELRKALVNTWEDEKTP